MNENENVTLILRVLMLFYSPAKEEQLIFNIEANGVLSKQFQSRVNYMHETNSYSSCH